MYNYSDAVLNIKTKGIRPHNYNIGDHIKAYHPRKGHVEGTVIGVELSHTGVYMYKVLDDNVIDRVNIIYEDEVDDD